MVTSEKNIQMIMELADAFGPSGFEDDVLTVARKWAEGLGTIEEDHMRNLYIHRKENTGNKPVIMLDAHSDEVGFMIHSIKPNGTLRFVTLGRFANIAMSSADVLVRNALGEYIPGVIAAKPVHFMSESERAKGGVPEISSMVIDIGATSAEEAVNRFHIRIGEPGVPATKCRYDAENDVMFGKGFDCRIGCAAVIETLRRLEGMDLPCDVIGVLSSQEEVGERGCKVSVKHANPSIAFVFEGCPADDTFTEPYVDNSQVIVVAEDAGIDDLAGLEGKTVGVQAASAALTLLEEDQKELADTFAELQQFADYNSAFVELQAGSIDAIAMDIGVAQYQIKSRDGFKILDESLNAEQYAVGFKKGNEELAQIVNADLQVLLENGTFDELAEKYELTDMVCLAEAFDDAEAETETVTE